MPQKRTKAATTTTTGAASEQLKQEKEVESPEAAIRREQVREIGQSSEALSNDAADRCCDVQLNEGLDAKQSKR